ncbi:hypothetical protein SLEP1_g40490 [Rubroshorea leprosula]|uniref:Rho-GAP domain-containing protein n=1 Tax=Rubroshorea leprosula TaxID=152421 RepID=A0AAV5L3K2_9ROSI|nr:hypothetical protein SLEP1_g40490 [Rubroshorea leprosula]
MGFLVCQLSLSWRFPRGLPMPSQFCNEVEGIFRSNAENGQEEYVREQLNLGVVPDDIDVHCLAGLIKAWFRKLPRGVLDTLSAEQVMQSQTEEECARLVRLLSPTKAALLDWAINLMADVAQMGHLIKMNARNIAMLFAPNMTQVMNFLTMLIIKTLREREDSMVESALASYLEPFDKNGHQSSSQVYPENAVEEIHNGNEEEVFLTEEPPIESPTHSTREESTTKGNCQGLLMSIKNIIPFGYQCLVDNSPWQVLSQVSSLTTKLQQSGLTSSKGKSKKGQSILKLKKISTKVNERHIVCVAGAVENNSKRMGLVSCPNSRAELFEA